MPARDNINLGHRIDPGRLSTKRREDICKQLKADLEQCQDLTKDLDAHLDPNFWTRVVHRKDSKERREYLNPLKASLETGLSTEISEDLDGKCHLNI